MTSVKIPRRLVTLRHNSTLNCDAGHDSKLNYDPCQKLTRVIFQLEYGPIYISSSGNVTHEVVKIQQRAENSTAKEGHNSKKNRLNVTPGRYSIEGSKFYLTMARAQREKFGGTG